MTPTGRTHPKRTTPIYAKITEPRLASCVPRTRLFSVLDEARSGSVVWITGPAGAGKTTLVQSYLETRHTPRLWYQADEGDRDAGALFHYMQHASRRMSRSRKALPRFGTEYQPGLLTFARRYFEALYARLPEGAVVVVDDYHEVPPEAPWHDVIREGASVLPPSIQLLVISRGEPPPTWARLRVSGELRVVNWSQLRLTHEEALAIARARQAKHPPGLLERACALSDGWVAGLVLLLERSTPAGNIEGHLDIAAHEIFDYFASETLSKLSGDEREFLLKTALLPTITETLATELTGFAEAKRVLGRLHRQGFFTERHSDPRVGYTYHPLFRQFLLESGKTTFDGETLKEVRGRAGELLSRQGQVHESLELFFQSDAFEQAIAWILREAPGLLAEGRAMTLEAWLDRVPEGLLETNGWLLYWKGICRLGFAPGESLVFLERALERFRTTKDRAGAYLAWSWVVQATIFEGMDFKRLDEWLETLHELQRDDPSFPSVEIEAQVATAMLHALHTRDPDPERTRHWAARALELSERAGPPHGRYLTAALAINYYAFFGTPTEASDVLARVCRDSRAPVAPLPHDPLPRVLTQLTEAVCASMIGDFEPCQRAVMDGLALSKASGIRIYDDHFHAVGACAAFASGDNARGKVLVRELTTSMNTSRFARLNHCFFATIVALSDRETASALRLAKGLEESRLLGFSIARITSAFLQSRTLLAADRIGEARAALAEASTLAERWQSPLFIRGCLLAEAEIALASDDRELARTSLSRAFAIGRETGIVFMPALPSDVLARLCAEALELGIEVEHVKSVIRQCRLRPPAPPFHLKDWPWRLRIFTLASFNVVSDDGELRLSGKPAELLQAVIALGGRDVTQEHLARALWPDADGDQARRVFDTTLHRLRKQLGSDEIIELSEGLVSLSQHWCWTDVWAVERLLSQLDQASSSREAAAAGQLLDLYGGQFLRDNSAAWSVALRERLHGPWCAHVVRLAKLAEDKGQWQRASDMYSRAIEIDDLYEPFYQGAMRCSEKMGRPAEALRLYERCRNVLRAQLQVCPSFETSCSYQSIRERFGAT